MKVIKLDAIDSTNDFLKGLSNQEVLENFTVVTAENQTNGKGQMGNSWQSEVGKNLIMSVLVKGFIASVNEVFNLNCVVSISIVQALEEMNIPKLSVKWPNDIMSDNKKIGGVLIENTIKSDKTISSVVGLGLNINQTNFDLLPNASSLKVIHNSDFDKEKILSSIIEKMKNNINLWNLDSNLIWSNYTNKLFKKEIVMSFIDKKGVSFLGIIKGVSSIGKLQIELENRSIAEFDFKEIQMIY